MMVNQRRGKHKHNEFCICVHCDTRIPHVRGIPCRENKCPQCGRIMFKEGSYHHQLFLEKKKKENKKS